MVLRRRCPAIHRGAAAIEMAIIVPFLVFLFAIAVDYCRVYNAAEIVNNAARCGAMYASGTVPAPSGQTPLQAAQQAALAEAVSLDPPLQATNVTETTGSNSVTVTVTYPFKTFSPYLGLPPTINVTGKVTMPLTTTQ